MKKLICLSVLLVTCVAHSALWDEKTEFDQKFNDCIIAIEKNDINFFKDNTKEIEESEILLTANTYGSFKFEKVKEYYHHNLLSIATKHKRKEIMKIILKLTYAQNYSYYKMSPLYWAVKNALDNVKEKKLQENDRAIVQVLLDNRFNPYMITSKDEQQSNSFDMAIAKNNLDLITMFIEADKKHNFARYGVAGSSPLHRALEHKKEDIALFLIKSDTSEEGELINWEAGWGEIPVHIAVMFEQYKALDLLINAGASLNKNAKWQGTAYHIAAKENGDKSILQLIENGANPSIKNKQQKLAEELTSDEDTKLLLKNARTLQEFCKNDVLDKTFDLITSFPLLSFTLHTMNSSSTFSTFYKIMNEKREHHKNIASLVDKENFQNPTDFRDTVWEKAQLRLKAHLYNISIISEFEYTQKSGETEFKKMLLTANRIKEYKNKD